VPAAFWSPSPAPPGESPRRTNRRRRRGNSRGSGGSRARLRSQVRNRANLRSRLDEGPEQNEPMSKVFNRASVYERRIHAHAGAAVRLRCALAGGAVATRCVATQSRDQDEKAEPADQDHSEEHVILGDQVPLHPGRVSSPSPVDNRTSSAFHEWLCGPGDRGPACDLELAPTYRAQPQAQPVAAREVAVGSTLAPAAARCIGPVAVRPMAPHRLHGYFLLSARRRPRHREVEVRRGVRARAAVDTS
jgi:hypothetical protein